MRNEDEDDVGEEDGGDGASPVHNQWTGGIRSAGEGGEFTVGRKETLVVDNCR